MVYGTLWSNCGWETPPPIIGGLTPITTSAVHHYCVMHQYSHNHRHVLYAHTSTAIWCDALIQHQIYIQSLAPMPNTNSPLMISSPFHQTFSPIVQSPHWHCSVVIHVSYVLAKLDENTCWYAMQLMSRASITRNSCSSKHLTNSHVRSLMVDFPLLNI